MSNNTIVIIDYNVGNVTSIKNMFKKIGVNVKISASTEEILNASKLILPGVGHFDFGMQQLKKSGLIETLEYKVFSEKTPLLGICLGAQLLLQSSEEGIEKGLGWIKGASLKFDESKMNNRLRIPNMGWLEVTKNQDHQLLEGFKGDERFYFVHSYHMNVEDTNALLTANYGYDFTAAIIQENIMGVQFHPEKSHRFGMQLLSNFAAI